MSEADKTLADSDDGIFFVGPVMLISRVETKANKNKFRGYMMECLSIANRFSVVHGGRLQGARAVKDVGIVLLGGFSLPEVAAVVEIFQAANAFAGTEITLGGPKPYRIDLLSAAGGRISSSSFVSVWTESIEARSVSGGFRMLFVGGGGGARRAVRDGRLTAWLDYECPRSELVVPMGNGRFLLEATRSSPAWTEDAASPLHAALAAVRKDLGVETARRIADHVVRQPEQRRFVATVRGNASAYMSEKIQASVRWLEENCERPITVDQVAQAVTMSERNFLRRFKIETGVTPSRYLLDMRLDMCCRLLAETDLPVDKVARRCGLGGGGWLSKLFRKHLATTPTEYRTSKRQISTSSSFADWIVRQHGVERSSALPDG